MNPQQLEKIEKATKDYPREFIGVIPFTHEITSNEPLEGKDFIPYGGTLFTQIAAQKGYKGLHFDIEWMNYSKFLQYNKKYMLNDNVLTIKDAIKFLSYELPDTKFFSRPSQDLKQYSGQVMTAKELHSFFSDIMQDQEGSYFVRPDFEVVLSTPKTVSAEWRWFIVDNQIISGSMYRAHDQMRCIKETDSAVIKEAQKIADYWLPDTCVVMDTALVDGEVKVIEYNCINASGFYDHDIDAVFKALWEYHKNDNSRV